MSADASGMGGSCPYACGSSPRSSMAERIRSRIVSRAVFQWARRAHGRQPRAIQSARSSSSHRPMSPSTSGLASRISQMPLLS